MRFNFVYPIESVSLETALRRFIEFVEEHGIDTISNLEIGCHPLRGGRRLQAVNQNGIVRPVIFDADPGDLGGAPAIYQYERETLIIRERPIGRGPRGLAALLGPND